MATELDILREYYDKCEFIRNEGLQCLSIESGNSVWTCEVKDCFCNPFGKAHGGFLFSVMDTAACSTACFAGSRRRSCVTLSADVHYTKSADKGVITIRGQLKKEGRHTGLSVAEVYNEAGELCAYGTFDIYFTDLE